MKNLIIIAAIGKNNELGKDNKLIWHIPPDLAFFRQNTIHKNIIMGSNTFFSLPNLLKDRHHIVLSKNSKFNDQRIEVYRNYDDLMKKIQTSNEEFYVIGGASIYKLFIDDVDTMLLTKINDICPTADAYFPTFDKNKWKQEVLSNNIYNGIEYSHVKYLRKKR